MQLDYKVVFPKLGEDFEQLPLRLDCMQAEPSPVIAQTGQRHVQFPTQTGKIRIRGTVQEAAA